MKLTELLLNRFLYKEAQSVETQDSAYESASAFPSEAPAVAAGGSAQDINTGNVTVNATQLTPGVPLPPGLLDVANWGWSQTCAFTSTDLDTVSWAAGVFKSSSGTSYSIDAGNTGNMSAKTYIYLDLNVSLTAYQITTTPATAVGLGKVLIAVAQNAAASATYNLNEASQIVGDNILANTINATKMNVAQLSAITADIGSITAGTLTGTIIQTDTTGTRVVIDGSGTNNSLIFYDDVGQVIGIGTNLGTGMRLDLTSTTTDGFLISSAVAGVGFQYTNSGDVNNRGIVISQTNNGSNNVLPCVELHHDGHYYAELIDATHSAGGLYIGNTGTLSSIYITQSSTASAIYLNNTGASKSLEIVHSGNSSSIVVSNTNTASNSIFTLDATRSYQGAVAIFKNDYNNASGNKIAIAMNITNTTNAFGFEFIGKEITASSSLPAGGVIGVVKVLCTGLAGAPVGYIPIYGA